jgi:hypothetical protein
LINPEFKKETKESFSMADLTMEILRFGIDKVNRKLDKNRHHSVMLDDEYMQTFY